MSGELVQEVVFSFDTTGSMYSCLEMVRQRLREMVTRLHRDIPTMRIAIFAHGDYCDARNYVTKYIDFTQNTDALCNFVQNASETGGGDADECYELVLREVRTKLSWSNNSRRALVLIGDCNPHEPSYPQNVQKIDWRQESRALAEEGVRIYSVQCLNNSSATAFYKSIAETTGGHHLQLDDFSDIADILMLICYREKSKASFETFEAEIARRLGAGGKDDVTAVLTFLKNQGRT